MHAHYQGQAFPAIDDHGGCHMLTPAYRSAKNSGHPGQPTFAVSDCVELVTEDGRPVTRLAKGQYLITSSDPALEIALSSDDPHAL